MGQVEEGHEERRRADLSLSLASWVSEMEELLEKTEDPGDPTLTLPHKFGRHLGTFSSHTKVA